MHKEKIFFCKQFKRLKLAEKLNAVKKLGACQRCLECHEEGNKCWGNYLCRNGDCRRGSSSDHHFFLCPKREAKKGEADKGRKVSREKSQLIEEQEKFMAELSPEITEKCRRAFTNMNAMTTCSEKDQSLMEASGLKELPVLLMLLEVTANAGQKI